MLMTYRAISTSPFYKKRFQKYIRQHNYTDLHEDYRLFIQNDPTKNYEPLCYANFLKTEPFFIVEGSKNDILATSCDKCWDMKDLRAAVSKLKGNYIHTDDFLTSWSDHLTDLKNHPEFSHKINLFIKNENNKEVREDFDLTGPEIAEEIDSRISDFIVHVDLIKHENLYTGKIKNAAKLDPTALYLEQDYSQNLDFSSQVETQAMFLGRDSCAIHGTIAYYLDYKIHIFTGGDFTKHPPEIPVAAMALAVDLIEEKFKVKIKRVYRKTDNCAERRVSKIFYWS